MLIRSLPDWGIGSPESAGWWAYIVLLEYFQTYGWDEIAEKFRGGSAVWAWATAPRQIVVEVTTKYTMFGEER